MAAAGRPAGRLATGEPSRAVDPGPKVMDPRPWIQGPMKLKLGQVKSLAEICLNLMVLRHRVPKQFFDEKCVANVYFSRPKVAI